MSKPIEILEAVRDLLSAITVEDGFHRAPDEVEIGLLDPANIRVTERLEVAGGPDLVPDYGAADDELWSMAVGVIGWVHPGTENGEIAKWHMIEDVVEKLHANPTLGLAYVHSTKLESVDPDDSFLDLDASHRTAAMVFTVTYESSYGLF